MAMILTIQAIFSLLVGWCVFALWRRLGSTNRVVYWLVTAGLLIRVVGGQGAFWVSYLHLPLARSLQIGRGLWVFAVDAEQYFDYASRAAAGGLGAILWMERITPSVFFVQTLALFMFLLGAVTAVAILLNAIAYLGCCLAIVSFGDPDKNVGILFAVAALSFSPSAIVWSLQPLKDTLFLFLVAAFFSAARLWQQSWRGEESRRRIPTVAVTTLMMVATLYGIAGIRWYFGVVIVLASMPFVLLATLRSQQRWAVLANAVVLVVLLGAALLTGAGPYLPVSVRNAILGHSGKQPLALPGTLIQSVSDARRSFEHAGGATTIGAGGATRKLDATLGSEERPTATADARHERKNDHSQTASVARHRHGTSPAAGGAEPSRSSIASPPALTSVEPVPASITRAPVPSSVRPEHTTEPKAASTQVAPESRKTALVPTTVPSGHETPISRSPGGVGTQTVEGGSNAGTVTVPSSPVARLFAGTAAVVLPLTIARSLGILDVRGGRGLWLFVEVDTVVFDIVLIFTLVSLVRAVRHRALSAPVFWMILIVTLAIGGALAYAVSNFGTLFRHRNMVFLGLILLPIALEAHQSRRARNSEPAVEAVQT